MQILKFPLSRITIWFVLGIAFSFYANPNPGFIFSILASGFAVCLIAFFFSQRDSRQQIYFGVALFASCFFAGAASHIAHRESFRKSHYIHKIGLDHSMHMLEITVREKLKSNSFNERFIGIVDGIDGQSATGKILMSFQAKDSIAIRIGQRLIVNGAVIKHHKPGNPDQFDYGKYLDNKSIHAQMYVGFAGVKTKKGIQKDIWYYSDLLRNRIISNLKKAGFRNEELQVAHALILGQQQEISPDILRDYQYAGAVHILSVSGLHVGFILLFLNFILKPMPKNKSGRLAKLAIILLSLWGFAIVAGLSPSVVRSATMFSFMALGMSMRRSTNIFHTLLVSLLLILLFEPSFLFDVGFQLSYVALFFILWMQPLLAALWQPESKILHYFWDILTVSFAAQIGAFPLSIYYFHQFPGLFFITNLVVIPFVSIIMLIGVVVMLMAVFGDVPTLLVKLLERLICSMNTIIREIASFEGFVLQDIPLNLPMLLGLYVLIFATIAWFKKPKFGKLIFIMAAVIMLQTCFIFAKWNTEKEEELIVFNVKKHTLIAERNGKWVTAHHDSTTGNLQPLKPYLTANFCQLKKQQPLSDVLFFGGHKILVIDRSAILPNMANPDIVLLRNSPALNMERLLQAYKPKAIIADASNFKTYAQRWESTCINEKIPFHYTREKGFYRLKK